MPYRKFDGRGLYIEFRPNGSKLWYFKYRFLGSEKRLALGAFPDVRLAEAHRMIRAEKDPSRKRRMAKIKARLSAGNSFQSVVEDFIAIRFVASKGRGDCRQGALVSFASDPGDRASTD